MTARRGLLLRGGRVVGIGQKYRGTKLGSIGGKVYRSAMPADNLL